MKRFSEINETKKITPKVFLGGTCNESTWRDTLIKKLEIEYFNPVVKDWKESDYEEELKQRKICDFLLYVITPKMTGFYSIAEVTEDSIKNPDKTIFCYLTTDKDDKDDKDDEIKFDKAQTKSLLAVSKMATKNGGKCFTSLSEVAEYLNKEK